MKKIPLIIGILIILALFASADFYLNNLDTKFDLDFKSQITPETTSAKEYATPINSIFKLNGLVEGYKVVSQVQTSQIFEKIDLSNIGNIKIYRNKLVKEAPAKVIEPLDEDTDEGDQEKAETITPEPEEPIFIYEVQGPRDQGSLTYLNAKLQFIAQITTETINETGEYGHNSFFFNDKTYEKTAFLLTQIGDNLFGFQYKRDPENKRYDDVRAIIVKLMSESTL